MGRRVIQRILICDLCGKTPEAGEPLWEMGLEVWCEECCNKEEIFDDDEPKENTE